MEWKNYEEVKMWLARDEMYNTMENEHNFERFLNRHPKKKYEFGELKLFYDKPTLTYDNKKNIRVWSGGREIATLQSYMYPQVRCGECMEISGGILHNEEEFDYMTI